MRELRRLRASCYEQVRGLPVPQPFDLPQFLASVGVQRGRHIRLVLVPGLAAGDGFPNGWWAKLDHEDQIYVEHDTSPLHRAVIALHEVGHMLCGHSPDAVLDTAVLRQALPDLEPAALAHMFATRHGYSKLEERQAEMVAALLIERAGIGHVRVDGKPSKLIDRLGEALGHPLRDERCG
ncbi:hypothetical protein P3T35_000414 [Kitasatospora sp. GP30]|uniref:hypothetical protein n=1 Tax=Kitasatospora sp. GP30 TaxID=3035084 RepID=UPI000C701179|nr:hypothetical protein [Kitasatospora sp. GP30]MDH6138437.1 hypothetical protein [Kitasatospora sp. GP30]